MRRKEERIKQGQTNNKAKQHSTPKAIVFPKNNELPRVGLEPTCTCTSRPVCIITLVAKGVVIMCMEWDVLACLLPRQHSLLPY